MPSSLHNRDCQLTRTPHSTTDSCRLSIPTTVCQGHSHGARRRRGRHHARDSGDTIPDCGLHPACSPLFSDENDTWLG